MNVNYSMQDRGNLQNYRRYLEAMDAVSIEKVASASVFFEPGKGNVIVDMGMASGTSSAILAQLFPEMKIIGVDINPYMVEMAEERYRLSNLSFRIEDGEKLAGFAENTVDGFFNCSAIHHITSFNGYNSNRALNTLKRQTELLRENGVLVVRDFVKPEEKEIILELSAVEKGDHCPSDSDLLLQFARTARSLAPVSERGFPLMELKQLKNSERRFHLFYTDAVEFIRRKDYYAHWEVELQEEYGYFTQAEFEEVFRQLGLRIIISSPVYNRWIINNRYKGQFRIFDLNGLETGFPPTNYIIAGEKTGSGKQIHLIRQLPPASKPFLKYRSYRNLETGYILDVVERPNDVTDIIPCYCEEERVFILAKHSYPRPLSNVRTDSKVLDGKHFSGYITEGISVSQTEDLKTVLSERFDIPETQYDNVESGLQYYTSPGGINEKVSSTFIHLKARPNQAKVLKSGFSGFLESGFLHSYDAGQLLTTSQTGALVEARLELNLYCLFTRLKISLPKWLGEKIDIKSTSLSPTSLNKLLENRKQVYVDCDEEAGFLRMQRAYFAETENYDSHTILEYVYPREVSANTLLTLPVFRFCDEIYVGLEVRDLPVPQFFSGNSSLLTLPAKRLPKDIADLFQLHHYISGMNIAGSPVESYFKLGEKYFPSIGITTEQVYPYTVCLKKPTDNLAWVSLTELCANIDKLEDAHLLIGLMRLRHATDELMFKPSTPQIP